MQSYGGRSGFSGQGGWGGQQWQQNDSWQQDDSWGQNDSWNENDSWQQDQQWHQNQQAAGKGMLSNDGGYGNNSYGNNGGYGRDSGYGQGGGYGNDDSWSGDGGYGQDGGYGGGYGKDGGFGKGMQSFGKGSFGKGKDSSFGNGMKGQDMRQNGQDSWQQGHGNGQNMAGHSPSTGSGGQFGPGRQGAGQKGQKGPPRREMDSLLEEMKARQNIQQQSKEYGKGGEDRGSDSAGNDQYGRGRYGQNHDHRMQGQSDRGSHMGRGNYNHQGGGRSYDGHSDHRGRDGRDGRDGREGREGRDFRDGRDGRDGRGRHGRDDRHDRDLRDGRDGGRGNDREGNNHGHRSYNTPSTSLRAMAEERDSYDKLPPLRPGAPANERTLHCKELPKTMNEETACQLFSRYGIVVGISISYVNDDSETTCGWVTMEKRDSASRAKEALHDRDVDGVPLWIEWAKGPAPQVQHPEGSEIESKDGCRFINVKPPADIKKRRLIDQMAKYVSQEGHQFEMIVMEKEPQDGNHEDFSFLFQLDTPDNIYYRWRVFAFTQGDNFRTWRTTSFRMHEGGAWWRPPHCEVSREAEDHKKQQSVSVRTNFSTGPGAGGQAADGGANGAQAASADGAKQQGKGEEEAAPLVVPKVPKIPAGWTEADIAEERERCRLEEKATQERQKRDRDKRGIAGGKRLSDSDWDRLELLLRHVSDLRCGVLETMVFCLDKSDWAIEITECITESLSIVETEMPIKVARLLVVSDILHNTTSSKPAAWAYRREFERSLPDILEHVYLTLSRNEDKAELEKYRDQVLKILHVWEDWGIFQPQYTRGLAAALVVGVKSLRSFRSKGDTSREPAWMEPKLKEWKRQHFSQLEKMCRTRGLRSSTAHLEPTQDVTLEQARQEWLIDRLVCYELHWHEKEQKAIAAKRAKQQEADDIDGESLDDLDGFRLEDGYLDGEPVDLSDIGVLVEFIEAERVIPANNIGGMATKVDEVEEMDSPYSPSPEEESNEFAQLGGAPAPLKTHAASEAAAERRSESPKHDRSGSERQQDRGNAGKIDASLLAALDESMFNDEEAKKAKEQASVQDIELEILELRASLKMKGMHQDEIEDICKAAKRQMLKELKAATTDSDNKDAEQSVKSATKSRTHEEPDQSVRSTVKPRATEESPPHNSNDEREKEKERDRKDKEKSDKDKERRDKEKVREKEAKEKEREDRAKEREKEKEDRSKEKEKEDRAKKDRGKTRGKDGDEDSPARPKARSRSRSRDRGRDKKDRDRDKEKEKEKDKEKEKEREKDKEKEKERTKKRVSSRSRSREQAKKKARK